MSLHYFHTAQAAALLRALTALEPNAILAGHLLQHWSRPWRGIGATPAEALRNGTAHPDAERNGVHLNDPGAGEGMFGEGRGPAREGREPN